ncbi:MAG: nucleotidyltransferase [Leptolyngbya sp. ERB_1_1]
MTSNWQIVEQRLAVSQGAIEQFCKRWKITEFALFGSVLRDDFRSDSDIDVMIKLAPNHRWGLEWIDMKDELQAMFQRKVDLISRESLERSPNLLRRRGILESAEVIYVAG